MPEKPATSPAPTQAAMLGQGKLPIEPVDRPVPRRESIQRIAMEDTQRSTIPTSKRKRAKTVASVNAEEQHQIEMDLTTQTELSLASPTDADVAELIGTVDGLVQLKDSMPAVAEKDGRAA